MGGSQAATLCFDSALSKSLAGFKPRLTCEQSEVEYVYITSELVRTKLMAQEFSARTSLVDPSKADQQGWVSAN
jgi:hypothetical protein